MCQYAAMEPPHNTGHDLRGKIKRLLNIVVKGMILLAAVGTACTCFPHGRWYLEGAAYWVPLYLLFAITGSCGCLAARSFYSAALGGVCVSALAVLIVPCYFGSPNSAPPGTVPNLRILQANVYEHTGDPAALMNLIRKMRPDVVLLQEADEEWEKRLRPLEADYPHKAFLPRSVGGTADLGIYWRIDADEPKALAEEGIPGAVLRLRVNGRVIPLFNVHLAAPFSPERAKRHRAQMLLLETFLKSVPAPLILAGDMNTGPWSPLCRALLRNTALASARQGLGILGTWPSFFGPFRVGVDQLLVSPGIEVVRCGVGPGIGSDHRPLITDLHIPQFSAKINDAQPRQDRRFSQSSRFCVCGQYPITIPPGTGSIG